MTGRGRGSGLALPPAPGSHTHLHYTALVVILALHLRSGGRKDLRSLTPMSIPRLCHVLSTTDHFADLPSGPKNSMRDTVNTYMANGCMRREAHRHKGGGPRSRTGHRRLQRTPWGWRARGRASRASTPGPQCSRARSQSYRTQLPAVEPRTWARAGCALR